MRETEDGYEPIADSDPITVQAESSAEQVERTLSLAEEGHLLAAAVDTSTTPHELESVEHRGGITLEYLDPRATIEFVDELWESIAAERRPSDVAEAVGGGRIVSSLEDPLSDEEPVGEVLVLESTADEANDTWREFTDGPLGEQIYGSFDRLEGRPAEVLAGNPTHTDYWYALAFERERTSLAWKIRSAFGVPYSGAEYHPHPEVDIEVAVDEDALPADPDADPLALLGERYRGVYEKHPLPDRAGEDTVELVAEFLVMGAELDLIGSLDRDDLDSISHDEIRDADLSLLAAFVAHVELLLSVHEAIVDRPDASIAELTESGTVPEPETLRAIRRRLDERVQLHRAYVDKMNAITIEEYVFAPLQYLPRSKIDEISREAGSDVAPIPDEMRDVLRIHEALVGRIESYLETADRLLAVSETGDGELTYELVGEEGSYTELAETRETVLSAVTKSGHYGTIASRLHARFEFTDAFTLHGEFGDLLEEAHHAGGATRS